MLFEQPGAVPDGAGVPLDEDSTVPCLNNAGCGKWPRTHRDYAQRAAGMRIAAQQRVHLGQGESGPIRQLPFACKAMRFVLTVKNCQSFNRQSTSVSPRR